MENKLTFFTNSDGNLAASFSANIVSETSISPRVVQHGKHDCTLELFKNSDESYLIEWDIINFDTEHIGIQVENGTDVIGYDGVFDLPTEVVTFLEHHGFNLDQL